MVSEYKLFKRSNKANLFIALVQKPVSQMKMTFQEIRIIATGPCIASPTHNRTGDVVYLIPLKKPIPGIPIDVVAVNYAVFAISIFINYYL